MATSSSGIKSPAVASDAPSMLLFALTNGWLWAILVPVCLITIVAIQLMTALPADPDVVPDADDALTDEAQARIAEYAAAGFRRVGPAYRCNLKPKGWIVPMVHDGHGLWGTVFCFPKARRTSCDIVTELDSELTGLMSSPDRDAGVAPAPSGMFRQILPRAAVASLLEAHLASLRWLESRGLTARAPRESEFLELLRASLVMQRHVLRRRPIRNTCLALWRVVSRRNPHTARLASQRGVEAQIDAVRSGAWPDAGVRAALEPRTNTFEPARG